MNVVMIMSGGVGRRFGAKLPKQYLQINGKPVIDYVIEKVKSSKKTDKIVIVMDKKYINLSNYISKGDFLIADNGKERYDSIKNGFDLIKESLECDKVLICDAVAPMIYPDLIDYYFDLLDTNDCVITAQKITGALGNYDYDPLDRENYYITQSPEAFKFNMITKYFNPNSTSQELAWQLPKETKKFLNFNFKNNLKLTYNFELDYMRFLINSEVVMKNHEFSNVVNKSFFETRGIKEFLLRTKPQETTDFLEKTFICYKELQEKYGPFKNLVINQSSRYGIILSITTLDNEEFIAKFIPEFLDRYETEKNAYIKLSDKYMCDLLGFDDNNKILFLKKLDEGSSAYFDDNINLTEFFNKVFNNMTFYDKNDKNIHIFYNELFEKKENSNNVPFCSNELKEILNNSIEYYNEFKNCELYLIHGDLRMDNILKHDNEYYAIDPIGYAAPGVFETARFIIDDIDVNKNFSIENRLELLTNYFSKWFDKNDILKAVYIFTSFIAYNSTFENDDVLQTKKYIKICSVIKKQIQ